MTSPARIEPRVLNAKQAAAHCGMSEKTFRRECPVQPMPFQAAVARWDRVLLDRWLDSLSNIEPDTGGEGEDHYGQRKDRKRRTLAP